VGTFIEPGGLSAYYVMKGLASGIGAQMLSPIHTCLVITLHYYEAGMGKTYHLLFMPTAVVFFTGGMRLCRGQLAGRMRRPAMPFQKAPFLC
jgi:hypothetical protein